MVGSGNLVLAAGQTGRGRARERERERRKAKEREVGEHCANVGLAVFHPERERERATERKRERDGGSSSVYLPDAQS